MARLLEDEDLKFHSILQPGEGSLTLYGGGGPDDTPLGQLELWWSMEFETRSWGIKDMVPHVEKLVLDGYYVDTDDRDTGELFRYEYPEAPQPKQQIGPDPDAPTMDNIIRLAVPKWKVESGIDRHRQGRTTFAPAAEVNLSAHTIEILF